MNKWLVYFLGIITGIILTFGYAASFNSSGDLGVEGLEMFEKPGNNMAYSQFKVLQVIESGCALAKTGDGYGAVVLIVPNENQHFYDDQEIILNVGQCAQHVGTYKYRSEMADNKTVPAVRIIDGVASSDSNEQGSVNNTGKTLFDKPGDCVSRKNFEVQKVLGSGDAIALEIRDVYSGYVSTSDLEVLILAKESGSFYEKQIIRVPRGKCARQIGIYKLEKYGDTKVIPIVSIE